MADIKIKKDHCPLILTHSLIGGKWKLKILWHILQGDNRFSELKKEIPGISEKVLYSNLKELEDARLLYREVIKEKKPSVIRYRLSEEGVNVSNVVKLIDNKKQLVKVIVRYFAKISVHYLIY